LVPAQAGAAVLREAGIPEDEIAVLRQAGALRDKPA
jgi:hypothetical protein